MDDEALAREFDSHRAYLRAVAYRMLGSVADADDVTQEAWLRLQRVDGDQITDVRSWLVRAVGRLCLDALRSARARREEYVGEWLPEPIVGPEEVADPLDRVTLDESVGLALLVVLETLSPAERTAFVLHDVFGLPFGEVADVVGRSAPAVRQLASRARLRVRSRHPRFATDADQQSKTVEAFLRAARAGDLPGLVRVLDPDVVWRSDAGGHLPAPHRPVRGADQVAAMVLRQAPAYVVHARITTVNGAAGIVVDGADVQAVIGFTVRRGRVTEVDAIYNPDKLRRVPGPAGA